MAFYGSYGGGLVAMLAAFGLASPTWSAEPIKAGDVIVRVRGIDVSPDESSTVTPIGGQVHADISVVPEVDFTYFVTDSVAFELIAAVTKHDVEARNTTLGTVDVGNVWLLPPTLTVQYHWPAQGNFSPYVGAGLNYTHFYDADVPGTVVKNISYGDSFGPALQAGLDVWLSDRWTFNVDLKKVWLNTNVKINAAAVKADVDLDPWIGGVGFGYKF